MKRNIIIFAFALFTLTLSTTLSAQSPSTIICIGTLTDIDGNIIPNEVCAVKMAIINSENTTIYQQDYQLTTNKNGEFIASATELPELFSDTSDPDSMGINLLLESEEGSTWLEGGSFCFKYRLIRQTGNLFYLTRLDDTRLLISTNQSSLWKFADNFPFAYLSSEFIISFDKELQNTEAILQEAKDLILDTSLPAEKDPSRGLKGGYAVGGYNRK